MTRPSVGKDVEQQEPLYVVSGNTKSYNYFGKTVGSSNSCWICMGLMP